MTGMAEIKLGPWPKGIDNVSADDALVKGCARDALNVDFDRQGIAARRRGLRRVSADATVHSLWNGKTGGFAMQGANLCRADLAGGALVLQPIATLPTAERVDYCSFNGRTYLTSRSYLGYVEPTGTLRAVGVPEAPPPTLIANAAGGLFAGRYAVAVSLVDDRGEEGGLSELAFVNVAEGGGLTVSFPTGTPAGYIARIYRTEANGDVLHRAYEVPVAVGSVIVGVGTLGRAADTRWLRRTPPGDMVRGWMGRLLIARGRFLLYSVALRPGLHDPRFAFVQMPRRITMLEGVSGGVYLGQPDGAVFLAGTDPKDWQQSRSGAAAPVPRASALASTDDLDPALELPMGLEVAVWLSASGYAIGMPDGRIVSPQAKRIRLPIAAGGCLAVNDGRITSIVS